MAEHSLAQKKLLEFSRLYLVKKKLFPNLSFIVITASKHGLFIIFYVDFIRILEISVFLICIYSKLKC